jgi:uncharacterized protein (TIGR02391 family)
MAMPEIPSFSEQLLQTLCDILGDTSDGLSGTEISLLLKYCEIEAPAGAGITKRYRLYQALSQRQRKDECANHVIHFIQCALDPRNFKERPHQYDFLRYSLNESLNPVGYRIGPDGKFRRNPKIATEADQRASQLRNALLPRNIHPDVMRLCSADLLKDHYLPVVLAAANGLCTKIRQKTGLESNGLALVDEALQIKNGPKLAFNTLQSESEISEHHILIKLIKGLYETFTDPIAPTWTMNETDAIDLLTMISMLHRRLDQAAPTGK